MRALRWPILTAVVVCLTLVGGAQPVFADPPGPPIGVGGGGGGAAGNGPVCPPEPLGGSGVVQRNGPYQFPSPTPSNVGMMFPDLDVEPIPVFDVISPRPGEAFEPIHLVRVRAKPLGNVLRDGSMDPGRNVLEWTFGVEQWCPDAQAMVPCEYIYHEKADGSIWEMLTLPDGQVVEHQYEVRCRQVHAFRAVGAPVDLGARLLAATRAQVTPAAIEEKIMDAFGAYVEGVAGLDLGWGNGSSGSPYVPDTVLAALTAAIAATGPCGVLFASMIYKEINATIGLGSVMAAQPSERSAKARSAAHYKLESTLLLAALSEECLAQAAAVPVTAVMCRRLLTLGVAIWFATTSWFVFSSYAIVFAYWLGDLVGSGGGGGGPAPTDD